MIQLKALILLIVCLCCTPHFNSLHAKIDTTQPPTDSAKERYHEEGLLSAAIDNYGNETNYNYDAQGRLIQIIYPPILDENDHPVRPMTFYDYDMAHQILSIRDLAQNETKIRYNSDHQPVEVTRPDGSIEEYIYFLDGTLQEQISPDGSKIVFSRDESHRLNRKQEFSSNGQLLKDQLFTYKDHQIYSTQEGKITTYYDYNEAGRVIGTRAVSSSGVKRHEWVYNAPGEKTHFKEWFGPHEADYVTKTLEYGEQHNPLTTQIKKSDGTLQLSETHKNDQVHEIFFFQEQITQNQLGQYVKLEEAVDAYGTRELKTYDALQRLEKYEKLNSLGEKMEETQIRYNVCGPKASEKHLIFSQGREIRTYQINWHYDSLNRVTALIEGVGTSQQKTTSYHYNAKGQIASIIKPDGTKLVHLYNSNGTLHQFLASDGSFHYKYYYDDLLRLVEIEDLVHHYTQTRRYNDFNELVEEHLGFKEITLQNQYDLAGRRTELTLPDHSQVLYHYEGALLSSIERKGDQNYTHHLVYQALSGKIDSHQLSDGSSLFSYEYDEKGRRSGLKSRWWNESLSENGYDSFGRICGKTVEDPKGVVPYSYVYGEDGQLIQEEGHLHKKYQYDSLFNRISEDGECWETNALNQLTKTPQTTFRYDRNGNLIEKLSGTDLITFEYDALNRLIHIHSPKQSAHYTYDTFHRQIRQQYYSENGHLLKTEYLIYDGENDIGKIDALGQIQELRILGQGKGAEIGAAIAIELQQKIYIPLHDHQGSVRCLIDQESQTVAEFYRYSSFGLEEIYNSHHEQIETSDVGNPWRFSSKRKEDASGLIAYGKRHYDPSMGRWTSPDPLFFYDTPNLYAFVKNDNLNHYDLHGLFSIKEACYSTFDFFYSTLRESYEYMDAYVYSQLNVINELDSFEKFCKLFIGEIPYDKSFIFHESRNGSFGDKEVNDKVRITYMNGILNSETENLENLQAISQTHGGTKVHYVFRGTQGWDQDIVYAINLKVGFYFGFRSAFSHELVGKWREMIQEMGGIDGGGTIIHYAHSLGGTETDRAKYLLTPEEQKMIRVITIGSATYIRNEGFQKVVNYLSPNDFTMAFEWSGYSRNLKDRWYGQSNIIFPCYYDISKFCFDHTLQQPTYTGVIKECGVQFLKEFAP